MKRTMNYRQSGDFARSSSTYWHRFGGDDFFGMTEIGAGQKVARDTRGLKNVKTAAAWTGATAVVGATFYGIGYGLNALWQNSPSSADVVEGLASAWQQVAGVAEDCLGVVQSGSEVVVSCVEPTGVLAVVGGSIFLCRLGLFIHNLQSIDNAMPGSHHNCDDYNLKRVRNCLLEALGIMSKNKKSIDSDEEIKKLVDEVNSNRKAQNNPDKTEIVGFNRFVLEKILKEIGGHSNDEAELTRLRNPNSYIDLHALLTKLKSNYGPLDFDTLSRDYGISQSALGQAKGLVGQVKATLLANVNWCFDNGGDIVSKQP